MTNIRESQGFYTTVATKLSSMDKQKLSVISEKFGLNLYQLFQGMLLGLVRYFDDDSQISDQFRAMIDAFLIGIKSIAGSFNPLALDNGNWKRGTISSAILFVRRKDCQQPQVLGVGKDAQGGLTGNYNTDAMLAEFLEATDMEVLRALEYIRDNLGLFSIGHTLHHIILEKRQELKDEEKSAEIRELFSDLRITSGQQVCDDVFYKRKHNRGDYTQITPHRERYRTDL